MVIFDDFISLKEAEAISGYHPDYIGALVRSNKVKGKRVGNKWYVSRKEIKKYRSTKHYVPIAKAASDVAKWFFLFIVILVFAGIGAAIFERLNSQPAPVTMNPTLSDGFGDQNGTQEWTALQAGANTDLIGDDVLPFPAISQ